MKWMVTFSVQLSFQTFSLDKYAPAKVERAENLVWRGFLFSDLNSLQILSNAQYEIS